MEQINQPFETRGHDLTGAASLEFHDQKSIKSFASLVPGMDTTRFEPVALKIFLSGETPIITLYAIDQATVDKSSLPEGKLPVRKFKSPISWKELFTYVKSFDLVVHNGKINFEEMWVENR